MVSAAARVSAVDTTVRSNLGQVRPSRLDPGSQKALDDLKSKLEKLEQSRASGVNLAVRAKGVDDKQVYLKAIETAMPAEVVGTLESEGVELPDLMDAGFNMMEGLRESDPELFAKLSQGADDTNAGQVFFSNVMEVYSGGNSRLIAALDGALSRMYSQAGLKPELAEAAVAKLKNMDSETSANIRSVISEVQNKVNFGLQDTVNRAATSLQMNQAKASLQDAHKLAI